MTTSAPLSPLPDLPAAAQATPSPSSPQAAVVRAGQPPGPRTPWWGIPTLRAMKRDYLGFTTGLHRTHGGITFMRLGKERAYDLFSPELVRCALVDNADALVRWERGVEVLEQLFGQSVLITEGATWQRQRRMLQPAFTPKRVAGYAGLMVDAARSVLDAALPVVAAQGSAGEPVDMDALFTRLTMDVILRTLFSAAAPADTQAAASAVQVLSTGALREMFWPVTLPDWLPLPGKAAKRHALRTLRALVARHIAERRQHLARPGHAVPNHDLLAMLLALRDDEAGGAPLTDAELFDQCMVTFQAGHETSASALLWWSRLMADHPEAQARALAEVDQVLGTGQGRRNPSPEDLAALPWLGATLKEAMRLYPPVAALMTRRTTRAIVLDGWAIPKGALLRLTPWVLQRDARLFPQPEAFRPERFLDGAAPTPRGAWLPFGTGPRVCIGQHFASLEMTLVAALLLQRATLRLPAGALPSVPEMGVTLRPRGGLQLLLAPR